MELKDQIRLAREAMALDQKELADLVGVSKQSVIWWETGTHTLRPNRQKQLEEFFGIKLDVTGSASDAQSVTAASRIDRQCFSMAKAISDLPKADRELVLMLIRSLKEKGRVWTQYSQNIEEPPEPPSVAEQATKLVQDSVNASKNASTIKGTNRSASSVASDAKGNLAYTVLADYDINPKATVSGIASGRGPRRVADGKK